MYMIMWLKGSIPSNSQIISNSLKKKLSLNPSGMVVLYRTKQLYNDDAVAARGIWDAASTADCI